MFRDHPTGGEPLHDAHPVHVPSPSLMIVPSSGEMALFNLPGGGEIPKDICVTERGEKCETTDVPSHEFIQVAPSE